MHYKYRGLIAPCLSIKIIVMNVYWIDLFSGAGGTTTGIHLAKANCEVIACVNHDAKAIESHKENHPDCLHFTEDVRNFEVVKKLKTLVENIRMHEPSCFINIWASLECTNYSKAKGGLPRDADSRTLAWDLIMYLENINPDYLYIENVREFMSWGKLDKNGRPIDMHKGCDYIKWVNHLKRLGYAYDWKMLNSANYGAYTSRDRYFGIFAKNNLPISWPESTHYDPRKKKPEDGLFAFNKKKWKPVKEVLDFTDEGESIFTRKKPLSENTLKRIYAGLLKFVAGGEKAFIKKYYSGRPKGKVIGVNQPAGTITTIDGQALVQANFLSTYYGNGGNHDIELPSPTVTTKDRISKISYMIMNYSNSNSVSLDNPAGTITSNPKHSLVNTKWLTDTQFKRKGSSIEQPSFTLIARMDKKPPYLIQTKRGNLAIAVYEEDNETMIKIKEFMALYGIIDIKMRMLKIPELLKIQGFPDNYKLKGTKTDQKKFIGNSVVPIMAQKLVEANFSSLEDLKCS